MAILFLLISLLSSGCHHDEPVQPDHPRQAAGVKMQDVTFYSSALGQNMPYRVYLPANVLGGQHLAVVYLLHGGGVDFRGWSNYLDVAEYARDGFILVMPDGDESYFMNEAKAPKKRYKDYITKDLIADVENRFPARKDREGRAVIGYSMGGFAAIEYALSEPQLFGFAGALSPAIDVTYRGFDIQHMDQFWKFRTIFGPFGSEERASRDPSKLVWIANPHATPYLYLTSGEQDSLLGPIRRFESLLRQRGLAHEFHTEPGGHNWNEWNAEIPGCFASMEQHLRTSAN